MAPLPETSLPAPTPLLEVMVRDLGALPPLTGLCAGFETGKWRADQLAQNLIRWLPDFALNYKEQEALKHQNAVDLLARAAAAVYSSEKYQKRGEFGELLLHAVIRQVFGTLPAISKIYYKDSPNDTVKGFDAVHVVPRGSDLELWLGEAKFYKDASKAMRDICDELAEHVKKDYLRTEFIAVTNKLDPAWPHFAKLKLLLDPATSLDKVFSTAVAPALITYESATTRGATAMTPEYRAGLEAEIRTHHATFTHLLEGLKLPLRVEFLLVPLASKDDLTTRFDARLKALQEATL